MAYNNIGQPLLGDGGYTPSAPPAPSAPDLQVKPFTAQALAAPYQDSMDAPWAVGPQNMYAARASGASHVVPDIPPCPRFGQDGWKQDRCSRLNEWGCERERFLHRPPRCLMDQMVSGSCLFPPRLLNNTWFTPEELNMISRLERILQPTGRAHDLARDLLTPLIYGIEVKIVLDDSGSMAGNMFGSSGSGWLSPDQMLRRVTQPRICCGLLPSWKQLPAAAPSPISPSESRWNFALDALRRWAEIYEVMGIDPVVYQMNGVNVALSSFRSGNAWHRGGSTPSTETLFEALTGRNRTYPVTQQDLTNSLRNHWNRDRKRQFVLILTDGEANDMESFMQLLDQCQNGIYGDIQICFLGISLQPADIAWFEDEECEETRIRTIEAFEVEQRQIRMREVVQQEAGYNFDLHSVRALVTNFFPADYDYEAPLQSLRHRFYITIHGRDRWWGDTIPCWKYVSLPIACSCFIGTGACCCGWCQGYECGKCHYPACVNCKECCPECCAECCGE